MTELFLWYVKNYSPDTKIKNCIIVAPSDEIAEKLTLQNLPIDEWSQNIDDICAYKIGIALMNQLEGQVLLSFSM